MPPSILTTAILTGELVHRRPELAPSVTTGAVSLTRDGLVDAVIAFLAGRDPRTLDAIRAALDTALDTAGPDAFAALGQCLATGGSDWTYYPPDPLARQLHHVVAEHLLERESAALGIEHASALDGRPVVIFANHLSYSDANLLEILLRRCGGAALADRLTVIAGPKVYSSRTRRFSSLCFGTIKTPQSSGVSSEDAVMNPREVARAAHRSIATAHDRLARGDALLVFAEGTRSRTHQMQEALAAATRYLEGPEVAVLPVGIVGTEALFPIGAETIHPVRITVRVGAPVSIGALRQECDGSRRAMMDRVGRAIAALLPPEYRGVYAS